MTAIRDCPQLTLPMNIPTKHIMAVILWIAAPGGGISLAGDPDGPIEYPGMKTVVDAQGVQAPGYVFRNDGLKAEPWLAQWITGSGWFRKEVTLDTAPARVAARVTSDAPYFLWVNGQLVSRGPVDQGRDYDGGATHRWLYDCRDLTPYFHQGRNVIAATGGGRFAFEAQLDNLLVKSDATWRTAPSHDVKDWQTPAFDDAAWPQARETKEPWPPLVASEIPPLMEARYPAARSEGLPPNKTFAADGSFKVVFDRVLSGYPTLRVKGGKGARVVIRAHREQAFTLAGGEQSLRFSAMTEIAPSFTVEFRNVTEAVEVVDAGAIFTSQPVAYRGSFECSDGNLNRLWQVSRWTVQICLQTHHLDSPNHQEPICDPGDYVIEAMVNYDAFAQPWLVRQDVRKFAWLLKDRAYRNFHTSYSLGWLQMLMDYYDHTGDQSLVDEMAPYVHELLDTYTTWRGGNGIISEAPNYMFMDWVDIGGFGCHHPPAVIGQGYLTAFYCHGLDMASRVAALQGDTARVAKYARLRQETAAAFNRELWVGEKGLYRDGKPFQTSVKPHQWMPADRDIETFSPHVNLLAVLYDLAPNDRQAAIVERVLAVQPLNTQPWFMHWVFQAIDHAGLFDRFGVPQMRRWRIVPETQSFREMWNGGDLSHGWCSTPLVQMSSRVLGVTPGAPGFKTITIRPNLCDLEWARGSVPTPHGDVAVAWAMGHDQLTLDVTVPAGTAADVTVPVSRFEQPVIELDGRRTPASAHVPAGRHRFVVTGKLK